MKMQKTSMLRAITAVFCLFVLLLFFTVSCATREKVVVERTGIKGTVIPVDATGKEIKMQDRSNIIVNCIPVKEGAQKGSVITATTERDGSFSLDLPVGEYVIEQTQ
jgi:hypothetical protein